MFEYQYVKKIFPFCSLFLSPQILKPMMLRRLKEDVEKSIASKEETIIEVHTLAVSSQTSSVNIFPFYFLFFSCAVS